MSFKQSDRQQAAQLLDALIAWTNADHEDTLTLSRNQCCYMRDEIERLRKSEKAAHDALILILPYAVSTKYADHPDILIAADVVAEIEGTE